MTCYNQERPWMNPKYLPWIWFARKSSLILSELNDEPTLSHVALKRPAERISSSSVLCEVSNNTLQTRTERSSGHLPIARVHNVLRKIVKPPRLDVSVQLSDDELHKTRIISETKQRLRKASEHIISTENKENSSLNSNLPHYDRLLDTKVSVARVNQDLKNKPINPPKCCMCGNQTNLKQHPDFLHMALSIPVCVKCSACLKRKRVAARFSGYLSKKDDSHEDVCSICVEGLPEIAMNLLCCSWCWRSFCTACVRRVFGTEALCADPRWTCPVCQIVYFETLPNL